MPFIPVKLCRTSVQDITAFSEHLISHLVQVKMLRNPSYAKSDNEIAVDMVAVDVLGYFYKTLVIKSEQVANTNTFLYFAEFHWTVIEKLILEYHWLRGRIPSLSKVKKEIRSVIEAQSLPYYPC